MSVVVWRVKEICDNCPFSKSEAGRALRASLRPGRMEEILFGLEHDGSFLCHKTLGDRANPKKNLHCAGALAWQKKYDLPNQIERIMERLAYIDPTPDPTPLISVESRPKRKRKRGSTKWEPITAQDVTPVTEK